MYYEFLAKDVESNKDTLVSQGEIEYLGDVLELFLSFLHGCGYSYVKQVVVVKDDGNEVVTG
jgi:hypothetical protein